MSTIPSKHRVKQLFTFLRELAQNKRTPCRQVSEQPFYLPLANLPHHNTVTYTPNHCEMGESLLRVERPNILPIPQPPKSIVRWLQKGWDKYHSIPRVARKLLSDCRQDQEKGVYELFESDQQRKQDFFDWRKKRAIWAAEATRAHLAKDLFEKLYQQYSHLNRTSDSHELLVGDGLLNWQVAGGGIHHPLLLKRVKLEFDVHSPAFTIVNTDRPPELYFPLLAGLEIVDIDLLRKRHAEFQAFPHHPLSDAATSFMKVLVSSISPTDGRFLGAPESGEKKEPRMWREPFLFIAKLGLHYVTCIDQILQKNEQQECQSSAIRAIVGLPTSKFTLSGMKAGSNPCGPQAPIADKEVYLCKPANKQQIDIARRLNKSGLVHVQGPPGTGKSYTIANLIGHLLAQGKRVLVTSHTEQALKVLKDKIPETLQSLCIPTFQSETGDFKDLEYAIQSIVGRASLDTFMDLAKRYQEADSRRDQLIARFKELWARQCDAVAAEYEPISCDGKDILPCEAADYLLMHREDSNQNWIPDLLALTACCPVSSAELAALYASNSKISKEEELEISLDLPDLELLPNPDYMSFLVKEYNDLIARDQDSTQANYWIHHNGSSESLEYAAARLLNQFKLRPIAHDWQMHAIVAGRAGLEQRLIWETLCQRIEHAQQIANRLALSKFLKPQIDKGQDFEEALEICQEICQYLKTSKNFGMFTLMLRPRWKQLINASQVNSGFPAKDQHFQALGLHAEQFLARQKILELWDDCIAQQGGPAFANLGQDPESICRIYLDEIRYFLNWHTEIWAPNLDALSQQGLNWAQLVSQVVKPNSPIAEYLTIREVMEDKFLFVVAAEIGRRREREIKEIFTQNAAYLKKYRGDVSRNLLNALDAKDPQLYAQWHAYLAKLLQLQPVYTWRQDIINKISPVLPMLANALSKRTSPHDAFSPPGDLELAWKWRKLDCEVQRRQSENLAEIQRALASCRELMCQETIHLVDSSAWHRQLKLFEQQPALLQVLRGLEATFRKIRSTRKSELAAKLKSEIQMNFPKCLEAVPVWIMSISKLAETLDPGQVQFDVLIIDEASQADLMGLIPLYMCKEAIVVGDDQQTSPEAIGISEEPVQGLISLYLQGIPYSSLYSRKLSIYELTKIFFGETILLEEHFRCVPAIIEFCNRLSYNGRIQPLREAGTTCIQPATRSIYVENGTRNKNKVNILEAKVIVQQIIEMIDNELYRNKSIGVISLLDKVQAQQIDDMLRSKLSTSEYQNRSIACGTPRQFQGDERDIIFLTLVDGPGEDMDRSKQIKSWGLGSNESNKKRLNVAVSRARDQLIVVHSVDPYIHLKAGDLRRDLILHALDPHAADQRNVSELAKCESPFEEAVLQHLNSRGYKTESQRRVGNFRIDIVVEGTHRRLAIECDGCRYHSFWGKKEADLERQAVLERLGWTFERIRGTSFYGDRELAMQPVYEKLEKMGIRPILI